MKFPSLSKKIKINKAIVGAILVAVFLIIAGVVYAGAFNPNCHGSRYNVANNTFDCYKAPGNPTPPTVEVTEHGVPKKCINNLNNNAILIPTNYSTEWSAFRNAVPNIHVSMTDAVNGVCPGGSGQPNCDGYAGGGANNGAGFTEVLDAAIVNANVSSAVGNIIRNEVTNAYAGLPVYNPPHNQHIQGNTSNNWHYVVDGHFENPADNNTYIFTVDLHNNNCSPQHCTGHGAAGNPNPSNTIGQWFFIALDEAIIDSGVGASSAIGNTIRNEVRTANNAHPLYPPNGTVQYEGNTSNNWHYSVYGDANPSEDNPNGTFLINYFVDLYSNTCGVAYGDAGRGREVGVSDPEFQAMINEAVDSIKSPSGSGIPDQSWSNITKSNANSLAEVLRASSYWSWGSSDCHNFDSGLPPTAPTMTQNGQSFKYFTAVCPIGVGPGEYPPSSVQGTTAYIGIQPN